MSTIPVISGSDLNSGRIEASILEQVKANEALQITRRVTSACLSCRRSHVSCDEKRPCGRCETRGLECIDSESRKRGPKKARKETNNQNNQHSASSNSNSTSNQRMNHTPNPFSPEQGSIISLPSPPTVYNAGGIHVMGRMTLPPLGAPPSFGSPPSSFPNSPPPFAFPSSPSPGFPPSSPLSKEGDYRHLPFPQENSWRSPNNNYHEHPIQPIRNNYNNGQNVQRMEENRMISSPTSSSSAQESNFNIDLEDILNSPDAYSLFASFPPLSSSSSPSALSAQEEEDVVPPSFFLRDEKSLEYMLQIYKRKNIKMLGADRVEWVRIQKKIESLSKFITTQQKKMLVKEFWEQLKEMTAGASLLETPVLIHERSGLIHYSNVAFLEAVGHKVDAKNLNPLKGTLVFDVVSGKTIEDFRYAVTRFFLSPEVRSIRLETGLKRWDTDPNEEEKYSYGLSIVTIKRDIFGLPQLFVTHWVPYLDQCIQDPTKEKTQMVITHSLTTDCKE